MSTNRLLIITLLATPAAFGQYQRPVKVNLISYFDKILPPPVSAKDAHDRCLCSEGDCTSDSLFNGFLESLIKLQTDISMPPGGDDLMGKMQDPEFKKKMETMTEDEKMKLAMEMSQNLSAATAMTKPEPEGVRVAMEELGKLNESEAQGLENLGAVAQKQQQGQQDIETRHRAVDDWATAELGKLPAVGGGEAAAPDPRAVYAIQMSAWKKHLAIDDEHLKVIGKQWADNLGAAKKRFAAFEASLEKIHYGDDAANTMTKSTLASGQVLMINSISTLAGASKTSYDDAAKRYEGMVLYQKQHPDGQ